MLEIITCDNMRGLEREVWRFSETVESRFPVTGRSIAEYSEHHKRFFLYDDEKRAELELFDTGIGDRILLKLEMRDFHASRFGMEESPIYRLLDLADVMPTIVERFAENYKTCIIYNCRSGIRLPYADLLPGLGINLNPSDTAKVVRLIIYCVYE